MTERVYLHVGEPKCGTTFLQNVLWSARSELSRQGVLLPGATIEDHFRATQDLCQVVQHPGDPAGSWKGEWDVLARQALTGDRVAIISHELLAGARPEHVAHAMRSLRGAEVHIVLTVRDMASLLPAEWQETVKHQNRQAWRRWLDAVVQGTGSRRVAWFWAAHDTLDVLRRWAAGVPPERVHVVTVPRSGAPQNLLWERFASVVGIAPDSIHTSVARPNSSLGVAEAEMLRNLNNRLRGDRQLPQWFYAGHVKQTLAHQILAARPKSARLVLPAELDEWAKEKSEALIAGLSEAGYDVVGELDELRPAPVEGPRPAPKDVSYKQRYDVALDALAGLLYERYEQVSTRPTLRDLFTARRTALPGSYRVRRI